MEDWPQIPSPARSRRRVSWRRRALERSPSGEFSEDELRGVAISIVHDTEASPVVAINKMMIIDDQNGRIGASRPPQCQPIGGGDELQRRVRSIKICSELETADDARPFIRPEGGAPQIESRVFLALEQSGCMEIDRDGR